MLLYEIIALIAISVVPLKTLEALKMTEVVLGDTVTLKCDLSFHYETKWLRMGSDIKPETLMTMGLNSNGHLAIIFNSNMSRFEGFKEDRRMKIRILKVSEDDLVVYFCAASVQNRIDFGEGMQLYTNQNVQQASENHTQCHQGSSAMSSRSEGQCHTHSIFAGTLSCGIVVMVLSVVTVHMKTGKKRRC